MKNNTVLFLIMIILCCKCISNPTNENVIPKGIGIENNGQIDKDEWNDVLLYNFGESNIAKAKVMIKHDGENLLLRYTLQGSKDSSYIFPEFFIDTKLDKGKKWSEDDYWFHVSAQDCYSIGKREDYTNCNVTGEDWVANPNYPFGNNYNKIENFEISVPLELLNLNSGQKIGICFSLVVYPEDIRLNIPEESNEDIPESWMELSIK